MAIKNFRARPKRGLGDGSSHFSTGAAQELGGIRFQYLPPYLALEILPFAARLDQSGADQLLDVMRDRRFGNGKLFPQLGASALPLARDNLEDGHAPRIRQRLGDQLELLLGQW